MFVLSVSVSLDVELFFLFSFPFREFYRFLPSPFFFSLTLFIQSINKVTEYKRPREEEEEKIKR